MANILTPDDATFVASVGNWGNTGYGTTETFNRVAAPTPPPSAAAHVGQVLITSSVSDAVATLAGASIIPGTIAVPSVYQIEAGGGFFSFDTQCMINRVGAGSVLAEAFLYFYDASGNVTFSVGGGSVAIATGDPWTALPTVTNSTAGPPGVVWVAALVHYQGFGTLISGDAIYISDNNLDGPASAPSVGGWDVQIITGRAA